LRHGVRLGRRRALGPFHPVAQGPVIDPKILGRLEQVVAVKPAMFDRGSFEGRIEFAPLLLAHIRRLSRGRFLFAHRSSFSSAYPTLSELSIQAQNANGV